MSSPLHSGVCTSQHFASLHCFALYCISLRFTPISCALHSSVGVVTPHLGIGCTAGDEDCWETFKELFYPVIKAYHGYDPETQVHHIYNRISLLLAHHVYSCAHMNVYIHLHMDIHISISRSAIVIMRHGASATCCYLLFLSISNDVCLMLANFVQFGNAQINSY